MCPKSNRLACRHWIFIVNKLLINGSSLHYLPKLSSIVMKSLELLLYDKKRICHVVLKLVRDQTIYLLRG